MTNTNKTVVLEKATPWTRNGRTGVTTVTLHRIVGKKVVFWRMSSHVVCEGHGEWDGIRQDYLHLWEAKAAFAQHHAKPVTNVCRA
jgi:hypothetical protein